MGNEIDFFKKTGGSLGIIPGAVTDEQIERAKDPAQLARVVADVLYGIVQFRSPDDKPGELSTEGSTYPFDEMDSISLGNGPEIAADKIYRQIADLKSELPPRQRALLESQFPQFSMHRHYNGSFHLYDKRHDHLHLVRLTDAFTNADEVKRAAANPVASLVGHLLFVAKDHAERVQRHGNSATLGFNSAAAVAAYVDCDPVDRKGVDIASADVLKFLESDASKKANLGPYPGFSEDKGERSAEIAMLRKYYPGLFVANHVPATTFGERDFGVS